MAYCEWHQELRNHYKIEALMRRLKIPRREAVGIIGCISSWTIGHRPGGVIEKNLIAVAVDWEKDSTELLNALLEAGWLDEFDADRVEVHDWEAVTSGFRRARKDAKRKRDERAGRERASIKATEKTTEHPQIVRGHREPRTVRGRSKERRAEQNEQNEQNERTRIADPRSSLQQQPQKTTSSGSSTAEKTPEGNAEGSVVAVPEGTEDGKILEDHRERLLKQASIMLGTPILEAIGVDGGISEQLARIYPAVRILHVAEHAKTQQNPGGFARKALEAGWIVPESNGGGLSKLLIELSRELTANDESWLRAGGGGLLKRAPDFPQRHEGESEQDYTARVNGWMKAKKLEANSKPESAV